MIRSLLINFTLLLFIFGCKDNSTDPQLTKEKILKTNEVVFFSSNRDGKATNIFMMTSEGQIIKQITKYDWGEYAATAVSPNRNQLLFYQGAPGLGIDVGMDIYIYKIKEDTIIGPITQGHPGNFSPDGNKFVFSRHTFTMEGGFESVYIYNLENKTEQKLTEYGKNSFHPQISPDGKYICYQSAKFWNRDSISCWQLHLMNINGNFISDLTILKNGYYAGSGVYTPDGQSIVFDYCDVVGGYDICKININAKQISYLAKINEPYLDYWNPSISNYSNRVYFYSKKFDEINKKYLTKICSINLEGLIFTVILNDAFWNSHPIAEKVSYYVYE